MKVICKDSESALDLVKRMVFLAYNAAKSLELDYTIMDGNDL